MKAAVQSLGKPSEAGLWRADLETRKKTQNDAMRKLLLLGREKHRIAHNDKENLDDVDLKNGGRSRT
jgi:hypothetical protein